MVVMARKDDEVGPSDRVPHLPWMRYPVDIDAFSGCPVAQLPRLDPRLAEALQRMGIESFFPVQEAAWLETIGPGAFERDICINSPTGSGKTLAYALPIVQMLSTRKVRCLRALVVLPTRDLALQVKEVFDAIAPVVGLTVGLAVGQSSIADEVSNLIRKPKQELYPTIDEEYAQMEPQTKVDILVATPGRLMDHINMTKGFSLEHLQYLVVDETDRMLREAYQSWLSTVIQLIGQDHSCHGTAGKTLLHPLTTIRRSGVERGFKGKCFPRLAKIILSATLTQDPSKLSQLELHHPLLLNTGKKRYRIPTKLESYKLICKSNLKPLSLIVLLQELQGNKCLVFTSSVESSHRLSTLLGFFEDLPFKFSEYSRLQREYTRRKTLEAFKEGKIDVLIGTDRMARGIHIDGLRYVINYDMPPYVKTYIHRAGRTARAGESGSCFTFLRKHEVKTFDKMLKKADNSSCSLHSLPEESIETLRLVFSGALKKLEESLESEAARKSNSGDKMPSGSKRKKTNQK
ncbi:DEAD-box ATP-dependent RNA helicase 1-like [Phragmites australis]|uniref:DEAD-box ATP-dependent RNA helicase 1-like n=1 Tax=Phragmites australis TaxID=29695 RepID=UPI002D779D25|nr:DEAD-box ATP-dependent RNA helicase 1-like [Phragmites australis]